MRGFSFLCWIAAFLWTISAAAAAGELLRQANSAAGAGHYEQALKLYAQAQQQEVNNPRYHHMYGRTMALTGDMYGAVSEYRKAVKLQANDAELLNDLGVALSASGDLGEAVVYLRQAIAANSKFVAAYNNLGATLMHQKDFKGAASAFQASLKMQPGNAAIAKRLKEALSHSAEAPN